MKTFIVEQFRFDTWKDVKIGDGFFGPKIDQKHSVFNPEEYINSNPYPDYELFSCQFCSTSGGFERVISDKWWTIIWKLK